MSDFELNGDILVKWNSRKREAIVPSGVRVIGKGAFNSYVKQFRLPEGVEIIEKDAFDGLYGATIYLPKSIKEIKTRAFSYFYSDANVVYAGDAETFKQIKIAKSGNTCFIKYLEKKLGVKSQATMEYEQKKAQKPADGKTKKQRVAEYLENYAKENPVEYVNPQEVDLDPWHNVIVGHQGLFQFKDDKSLLLVSGETVSANCARRLGKMQMKKALNDYCKYVKFSYAINPERKVESLLEGKEPKWARAYTTSYKQVPLSVFDPLYKKGITDAVLVKDGIIDVQFEKTSDGGGYAKIWMGNFPELPKQGTIQIPVRFRLLEEDIPTTENISGYKKSNFLEEFPADWEDGCCYAFCVGERNYWFDVEYYDQNGSSEIKDYKIANDDKGYYIDVLLEMYISQCRGY